MFWLTLLALAADDPEACEVIGLGDILAVPPPAVIVLGDRPGHQPDLSRATRVVNALLRRAPVTVALEAVDHSRQSVLDAHAAGEVMTYELYDKLAWDTHWAWSYDPYEPLVTAARRGARVVAAGSPLEVPSAARTGFPLPSGYATILRDTTSGHDMSFAVEGDLIRMMAWRDYGIATHALEGWDRVGYLVVVTGRERVEGGKGVAWQAQLQVRKPVEVHSFVLAWGGDPPCYPGDRYWRGLTE